MAVKMIKKKAPVHPSNLGHAGNPFCERLVFLIGSEVPYRWAERIGIPKATFYGIWRDGAAPQKKTIDRIVKRTGVAREWLLHGRGEPSIMFPHPTPLAPGYTEDRVERVLDEIAASSLIETVAEATAEGLRLKRPLTSRQKARLVSAATKIFLALRPEDRGAKFPALLRAIVDLLIQHNKEAAAD